MANREMETKLAEKLGLKTALGHICAKNRTEAELIAECLRLMEREEWVKVSERLPEVGEDILCWDAKERNGLMLLTIVEQWLGPDGQIDRENLRQMFTHWREIVLPTDGGKE